MSLSWNKIAGTQLGKFSLGFSGVTLKNNVGNLQVRNSADTAYTEITLNKILLDNNTGSTVIIQTSSTASSYTLTLPSTTGTSGQVLSTDGSGNLSWVTSSGIASLPLSNGSSNFDIPTANGTATITTNGTYTWLFTESGDLVLPSGGNIIDNNGNSVIPTSILDLGITDGTNGQVLTTNGAGTFTFTTIGGGGQSVTIQAGQGISVSTGTTTATYIISAVGTPQQDTDWGNVVLLLNFDEPVGTTNIVDSSPQKISMSNIGCQTSAIKTRGGSNTLLAGDSGYNIYVNQYKGMGLASEFTIEGWVYFTEWPNGPNSKATFLQTTSVGDANGSYLNLELNVTDTGLLLGEYRDVLVSTDTQGIINGAGSQLSLNSWINVSIVRLSNSLKLFVSGAEVGSVNVVSSTGRDGSFKLGNIGITSAIFFDSWRVTNGKARYTANYTPADSLPVNIAVAKATDQYYQGISILLKLDDPIGFGSLVGSLIDSGPNNVSVFADDIDISNTNSVMNGRAAGFGQQSRVYTTDKAELFSFSGDFTIEGWVLFSKPPNVSKPITDYTTTFFSIDGESSQDPAKAIFIGTTPATYPTANLTCSVYGTNITTTGIVVSGTWYFVALVRKNNVCKIYLDGINVGSATVTDSVTSGQLVLGGQYATAPDTTARLEGLMDEWRVTRGIARYTDNFTRPTQPFASEGASTTGLSVATTATLGAIIVGNGLSITSDGVLSSSSASPATTTTLGTIIVGDGLSITESGILSTSGTAVTTATTSALGTIIVGNGLSITPNGILSTSTATTSTLGTIIVGNGLSITSDGILSNSGILPPATATVYAIPTYASGTGTLLLDNPLTTINSIGVISAAGFNSSSTVRIKTNVQELGQRYIDLFDLLQPKEYDRTDNNKHEFGFIAEEMQDVYPEIVSSDSNGIPAGIDYTKLSTILTAKVKQQKEEIDTLKQSVNSITEILNQLMSRINKDDQ